MFGEYHNPGALLCANWPDSNALTGDSGFRIPGYPTEEQEIYFIKIALNANPWTAPAILVTVLLVLGWLGFRKWRTNLSLPELLSEAFLLGWVGCYFAVTLTPSVEMDLAAPMGSCNFQLASPVHHLFSLNDRSMNVWIAVPAGIFAVGSRHWRLRWIIASLGAPIFAETWQHWIPALMRLCHIPDIQDNYQGLLIGVPIGVLVLIVKWVMRRMAPHPKTGTTMTGANRQHTRY